MCSCSSVYLVRKEMEKWFICVVFIVVVFLKVKVKSCTGPFFV